MSGSRGIKSFVSETEAEEVRKKRQEEWEKVRKPDDPEGELYDRMRGLQRVSNMQDLLEWLMNRFINCKWNVWL